MSPAMAGGSFTTEPPGKPSRREFYSSKTEDYSPGGSLSIVPRNCSAGAWSSGLHLVRTKDIDQTFPAEGNENSAYLRKALKLPLSVLNLHQKGGL